ncbi:hypothetical protein VM98_11235 [Streptomyces rubellomurinus subsp. indigoferus]|nr:hypothetical protein VM98_11235 [Streptomyces rubellomurinus subsp. indigoferus]
MDPARSSMLEERAVLIQEVIRLRTASLTSGRALGQAHWRASCSVRTIGSVFSTVTAKLNWRVVPPRLFS